MHTVEPKILLISDDESRCSAMRSVLKRTNRECQVASVRSLAAARHTVADLSPDVIVLEEASLHPSSVSTDERIAPLADIVSNLAGFAPVVVLGTDKLPESLAALIAAGAADFVPAGEAHLPEAAACVEKHLLLSRRMTPDIPEAIAASSGRGTAREESFGEILRHELNNPLTGILGNAELLLVEMRRKNGSQVSESGIKRLETIAALAVRMRETVRRLSQACEIM